jgi:hypothetical protein
MSEKAELIEQGLRLRAYDHDYVGLKSGGGDNGVGKPRPVREHPVAL